MAIARKAEKMRPNRGFKLMPPDGGWGWMAVFGVSVVNMCTRAIEPSFGLLFGDLLHSLNIESTGAAVIMSVMDAVINLSGLLVGPLCKHLSFRKVAIIGAVFNATGLMATCTANSMLHILLTYSLIGGLGTGLASSATFVSLNHYFISKRGQAVGLSLAGAAAGFLVYPQAVRFLSEYYGFTGSVLILGAIALHSIPGSALLQPVKWHMKKVVESDDIVPINMVQEMKTISENVNEENGDGEMDMDGPPMSFMAVPSHSPESKTLLQPRPIRSSKFSHPELSVANVSNFSMFTDVDSISRRATVPKNLNYHDINVLRNRKISVISTLSNMDFTGSSVQLHMADLVSEAEEEMGDVYLSQNTAGHTRSKKDSKTIKKNEEKKSPTGVFSMIYKFLDLDLLKDKIYINLLVGLSLFYVAEQNFKLVMPFFFESLGYSKSDTALCLSVTAVMDIIARVVLPPICDKISPRIIRRKTLFMISCVFLGTCRSFMAEETEWYPIMVWFIISGFLRGAVLINFTLTVSEWCPTLERLPAAFGLHMVAKGIFVIALGPVLGLIRDNTGSYPLCLHAQTFLMFACTFVWSIEYIIVYCKSKKTVDIDLN